MAETAAQKKTREAKEAEAAATADPNQDAIENAADFSELPDPELVPVVIAWGRVMQDVQVIAKSSTTAAAGKYKYRGVDQVMDEFGPVLRKHGVLVIPFPISLRTEQCQDDKDKRFVEAFVEMGYRIYGPMGEDSIVGGGYGQASDYSDKAVDQAQSVAYRGFMLRGGCVPTGNPEPDESEASRGSARSDGGSRGEASSSRGRAADPAPIASNEPSDAERAAAVAAGWAKGPAERLGAWNALISAQKGIDANFCADILAWGRSQVDDAVAADSVFDESTLTLDQAKSWQVLIDRARTAEAKAVEEATQKVEEGFGEGVHQEQQYEEDQEPF